LKFKIGDLVKIDSLVFTHCKTGIVIDIDPIWSRFPYIVSTPQDPQSINFRECELEFLLNNLHTVKEIVVPEVKECPHDWERYFGLTETYNWCKLCNKKEGHL
jgi:hypothetical protein